MIRTHLQSLVDGKTVALGLLFAALVAASLLFVRPAHAETFTVNNTIDPGNGTCSAAGELRSSRIPRSLSSPPGWDDPDRTGGAPVGGAPVLNDGESERPEAREK